MRRLRLVRSILFSALAALSLLSCGRLRLLGPDSEPLALYQRSDPHGAQTIATSNQANPWVRLPAAVLHRGLSDAVVWLSVRVPSAGVERLLEIAYPPLDEVDVYVPIGDGRLIAYRGGDRRSFLTRVEDHRNHQFSIPPGTKGSIVIRVHTESALIVPVSVWRRPTFQKFDLQRVLVQGAYFGAALAIAAYNFFLFLSLRERSYAYYVLHVLLYGLYFFIWNGFAAEVLWPDSPVLNDRANPVVAGLGAAAGFLFVRSFLGTKEAVPGFDLAIRAATAAAFLCTLLGLVGFYRYANYVLLVLGLFAGFVMPLMGAHLLHQGVIVVRYLLASWSIALVLIVLNSLRVLGFVAPNFFTEFEGVQVGSVFQFVLLSLALADRFRRIRRQREEAEAANAAKTVFLSNMSHEIRTPLNSVIGMAELLDESALAEPQGMYARSLVSAGRNLLAVVNDVLDISKIESGRTEIRSGPLDPVSLLTNLRQTVEAGALRKGLMVSWELDPGLPSGLSGDEGAIRQVLLNLLTNAVKFTEHGEVALAIRVAGKSSESCRVRFEVRDTGIGIERKNQTRIFEAFAQADESRSRAYGGTGLGLAISRRLVGLMGGRLEVESTHGIGSRFHFELILPFDSGHEKPAPPAPPATAVADTPAAGGQRETPVRILLAEDNEDNRILVRAFLLGLKHTLVEARDGVEAEQAFLKEPFDIVLMDVQMPRMDGLETVRRIREHEAGGRGPRRARTPIVTLTAHALNEEVGRSIAAGCDAHLTKPIHRQDLLAAIAEYAL